MNPNIPNDFLCPINLSVMKDPVICTDGHTYERTAIEQWFQNNNTSPKTGINLISKTLIPNIALRNTIEEFFNKDCAAPMEIEKKEDTLDVLSTIKRNPAHIICVIDTSGSMRSITTLGEVDNGFSRLDLVKHSLRTIVATLLETDLLTIIPFNTRAHVALNRAKMTTISKVRAEEIIEGLRPDGSTNIWDGLVLALETGLTTCENINTSIVLLTDGLPEGTLDAADILRHFGTHPLREKIPITTIGYDYNLDIQLLTQLAEISHGRYMYVPDVSMIGTVFTHYLANVLSFEKSVNRIPRQLDVPDWQGNNDTNLLISLLQEVIKVCNCGNYDKAVEMIKQHHDNIFTDEAVKQDLLSDDPNMGQIGLAASREYYKKWGRFYLPMLLFAHRNNECCNFKDRSVQRYGGATFAALKEAIDHLFSTLPAPKPTQLSEGSVRIANMSSLNMSNNICFDGSGMVKLKNGSVVQVSQLQPYDYVETDDHTFKQIRCIITQNIIQAVEVCRVKCCINDFLITPWHPVKVDKKWVFPHDLYPRELYTGILYNIVLENGTNLLINDIPVITLGNGISSSTGSEGNEIAYHPYFGNEIVKDLQKLPEWSIGMIDMTEYKYIRNPGTNLICGFVRK